MTYVWTRIERRTERWRKKENPVILKHEATLIYLNQQCLKKICEICLAIVLGNFQNNIKLKPQGAISQIILLHWVGASVIMLCLRHTQKGHSGGGIQQFFQDIPTFKFSSDVGKLKNTHKSHHYLIQNVLFLTSSSKVRLQFYYNLLPLVFTCLFFTKEKIILQNIYHGVISYSHN